MAVQQLDMKETRSKKLIEKQEQRECANRPEDSLTAQCEENCPKEDPEYQVRKPIDHAAGRSISAVAMDCIIASSEISASVNSPTFRRSRRISTRLLCRTIFSSSELIKSPARPSCRSDWINFSISAFAPTSIPRVGSSRINNFGSVASHRASKTFCWFPPLRLRNSCS